MAYNFSTGSGPTNLGHSVEYRFDWGDGTYSEWSSATTVSQSWTSPGDYVVRAQARCATDKHIESGWSDGLPVTIEGIGPDLTGKWVSLTQSCSNTRKGKKCKIKGTSIIENVGNRDALSCKLSFYKSDDDVFGDSDIFLKSVSTGAIKFGKSKSKTLSYSFPLGDSATRKYIIAVIDADENISEIEEVNNFIVFGPVE